MPVRVTVWVRWVRVRVVVCVMTLVQTPSYTDSTPSHQPLTLAPGHLSGGVDIRLLLQQQPDHRFVAAFNNSEHQGCPAALLHTRGWKGTWGVRGTRDTHAGGHYANRVARFVMS